MLALSREQVARLCRSRPRTGRTLRYFSDEPHGILLAARVFRLLVQSAGAALGGAAAHRLGGAAGLASFILLYGLLLVLGTEILARTLGTRYAGGLAPWLAVALQPMLWVASLASQLRGQRAKAANNRRRGHSDAAALQEVSGLLRLASLHGARQTDPAGVFAQAQNLSQLKVKDVMVERQAVKFLSSGMSLSQALVEAHLHHHTRFPLLRDRDPDEVIGYVNFKDIVAALQLNPANPSLAGICRPILTVEEGDSLSSLLDRLTGEYQHIALVRDRKGAVAGLATLEDTLEAVLGGMSDKPDRLPDYCYPIAEDRYVAGGGVSVQRLRRELSLNLPDLDETLDSLLRQLCGGTPSVEQKVEVTGVSFTVRRMSGTHVREAIIDGAPRGEHSSDKGS